VTSVRGIAPLPITAASVELVFIGFMNAALGLRFLAFFAFAIDYLPLIALKQRGWLETTSDREICE
jgi:hypothetical protein